MKEKERALKQRTDWGGEKGEVIQDAGIRDWSPEEGG